MQSYNKGTVVGVLKIALCFWTNLSNSKSNISRYRQEKTCFSCY